MIIHGIKATRRKAGSSPIWSAAQPTGEVNRLASPHDNPIESELTVLRVSGQRCCDIAVVTEELVVSSAKPSSSIRTEAAPLV